jgi:hypothetical protein
LVAVSLTSGCCCGIWAIVEFSVLSSQSQVISTES